jgi:hypothetical protein
MNYGLMIALIGAALLGGSGLAEAQPADIVVSSVAPDLTGSEGTTRTVELELTNLTANELRFTVTPTRQARNCVLTPVPGNLPAAQATAVSVAVSTTCRVGDTGLNFVIATGTTAVALTAKVADTNSSPWAWLWTFPAVLLLAGVGALIWRRRAPKAKTLPYLDSAWSFKDSWASNVTVLGGLFTGVFGSSEVVKALLGEDADSKIALATVGSAVAVAFIAAGPILILATKSNKMFTTSGLLAAAAVTLTGAVGELVVVTVTATKLDLGGWERSAWAFGLFGLLLLLVYSYRTIHQTMNEGYTPPKPEEDSDIIKAAQLVATAISTRAKDSVSAPAATIEDTVDYIQYLTKPIGARVRRRSASL